MNSYAIFSFKSYLGLPVDLKAELAAFDHLSDDVLFVIANTTPTIEQQHELRDLNYAAQARELSPIEQQRQDELVEIHDRNMVRRAHAGYVLMARGHDTSKILIPIHYGWHPPSDE